MPGSLTVVGTGLRVAAHTTAEALVHIREADKLFYMVADTATEAWLRTLNETAETLSDAYAEGKPLDATYEEATGRILAPLERGLDVCAAFYGHPGVMCTPARRALRRARRAGWRAEMLPGVSALDCLLCDLAVDPGADGCQVFEATSFLVRGQIFDPTSHLVLMQIGLIGTRSCQSADLWSREGLSVLAAALEATYGAEHAVVLYQAARFPLCEPVRRRLALRDLPAAEVTVRSTLYVPPLPRRPADPDVLAALGMPPDAGERRA